MESIIFLHSKGGETRRKVLQIIHKREKENLPNYANLIKEELEISKVATKNHIDYLSNLNYIEKINPDSKPIFLKLTNEGKDIAKKYIFY